jgi:hypothetical protein
MTGRDETLGTCQNCRLWHKLETPNLIAIDHNEHEVTLDGYVGLCRKHPPTVAPKSLYVDDGDHPVGSWPLTFPEAWCGEWEIKK